MLYRNMMDDKPFFYKCIPTADHESVMYYNAELLTFLDDRFRTRRNMELLRDTLISIYGIELKKEKSVRILIDEYHELFIGLSKFKIHVYMDVD